MEPYQLVSVQLPTSRRRRIVQTISRMTDAGTVMVRMVPGDPATAVEVGRERLEPVGSFMRWLQVAEFSGNFIPEDMLRYDCAALYCHTQPELDQNGGCVEIYPAIPLPIYRVTRKKTEPWTIVRWQSFGCVLRPILTVDLRD